MEESPYPYPHRAKEIEDIVGINISNIISHSEETSSFDKAVLLEGDAVKQELIDVTCLICGTQWPSLKREPSVEEVEDDNPNADFADDINPVEGDDGNGDGNLDDGDGPDSSTICPKIRRQRSKNEAELFQLFSKWMTLTMSGIKWDFSQEPLPFCQLSTL